MLTIRETQLLLSEGWRALYGKDGREKGMETKIASLLKQEYKWKEIVSITDGIGKTGSAVGQPSRNGKHRDCTGNWMRYLEGVVGDRDSSKGKRKTTGKAALADRQALFDRTQTHKDLLLLPHK